MVELGLDYGSAGQANFFVCLFSDTKNLTLVTAGAICFLICQTNKKAPRALRG